jgi:hypothetical protein
MKRHSAVAVAASALATVSVVLVAPSANADLVTHCVGTGGAVTVPGDLLVPAGESCTLEGTTVTGNVRVAAGSNLIVTGGTFNGEVRVAGDGYFDATDTTVTGQVVLAAGGFGVFMREVESGRVIIQPRGTAPIEGFLFVEQSTINGTVTSGVGEFALTNTQVTGNVSTNGAYYTDLTDSFVDGTLSVTNNEVGSVVCGSAIHNQATFTGNQGGVQLGPNGHLDSCATGSYFARDVMISSTTGRTVIDDNIINGRLVLETNTPIAEVAENNRIRGGIVGDHTEPAASRFATAAPRDATAGTRAADRRTTATAEATAAGPARI